MNLRLSVCGVLLGVLANYLLWGTWTGVGFPIVIILMVQATLWSARASGKRVSWGQFVLAYLSIAFSLFVAIRGAEGLTLMNVALALYFWLLLGHSLASERDWCRFGPWDYSHHPTRYFFFSVDTGVRELSAQSKRFTGVTRFADQEKEIRNGIALAIPVLIFFLILMAFADDRFQSFLFRIGNRIFPFFQNLNVWTFFGRGCFVFVVSALAAGSFFLIRNRMACPDQPGDRAMSYSFLSGMTLMSLVNVLFLVFAIFQVKFMLGHSSSGISDLTNRENFYVMMAIGVIAFLGICVLEGSIKRQTELQHRLYLVNVLLSVGLCLIIMASAYSRFCLYEAVWGLTIRRFYAHSFVPFVGAFFLLLTAKIVRRWPKGVFLNASVILSAGLFLFWNILNPHAFVAKKNLELMRVSGRSAPPVYLQSLSYDAVPVLIDHQQADPNVSQFLSVQKRILQTYDKESWQGAHWGRWLAYGALNRVDIVTDPVYYGNRRTSNVDSWLELLFFIALGLGMVSFVIRFVP